MFWSRKMNTPDARMANAKKAFAANLRLTVACYETLLAPLTGTPLRVPVSGPVEPGHLTHYRVGLSAQMGVGETKLFTVNVTHPSLPIGVTRRNVSWEYAPNARNIDYALQQAIDRAADTIAARAAI